MSSASCPNCSSWILHDACWVASLDAGASTHRAEYSSSSRKAIAELRQHPFADQHAVGHVNQHQDAAVLRESTRQLRQDSPISTSPHPSRARRQCRPSGGWDMWLPTILWLAPSDQRYGRTVCVAPNGLNNGWGNASGEYITFIIQQLVRQSRLTILLYGPEPAILYRLQLRAAMS